MAGERVIIASALASVVASVLASALAIVLAAAEVLALAPVPLSATQLVQYRDPAGRFAFDYPATYGVVERGTDDGFGGRAAAFRFAAFSTRGVGGEAVLVRGTPFISALAVGGLYDDIASGTLPDPVKAALAKALQPLSADSFCDRLRAERHFDPAAPALSALPERQRQALVRLDVQGHVEPRVLQCESRGGIVTFQKEAAMVAGGPRRHAYGAIRFLSGPYSAFFVVRAGAMADAATLKEMTDLVASWRAGAR